MQLADLDLNGSYTYADYYNWDFEDRVELIKGRIFKKNPINYRIHAEISGKLLVKLYTYLKGSPNEVYHAPFDVRFPHVSENDNEVLTVLQPDLCVVCDPEKLDERGCTGVPEIVIEILDPGDNTTELKVKPVIYQDFGVKEYWIVSPQNQWVKLNILVNDKFQESPYLVIGDTLESTVLPGFSLNIEDLFKGINPDEWGRS